MGELNEHDLDRLFRGAGHSRPAVDLTDRIMARVAVTPIVRPTEVKPVIGPWGWGLIGTGVLLLLVFVMNSASGQPAASSPVPNVLRPMLDGFSVPTVNWTGWMFGAAGCLLVFTVVDRLLAQRSKADH